MMEPTLLNSVAGSESALRCVGPWGEGVDMLKDCRDGVDLLLLCGVDVDEHRRDTFDRRPSNTCAWGA